MTMKRFILATTLTLAAAPALAHSGAGVSSSFTAGLLHPMSGLDHVLATASVGMLAFLFGGRALWAIPGGFLAMMLTGGAVGFSSTGISVSEIGIAVSVIVLGCLVVLGERRARGATMGLAGLFAVFHGYAHIAEMPGEASALPYCLGFLLGSVILLCAGVATAFATAGGGRVLRVTGAAVTVAGLVFALG